MSSVSIIYAHFFLSVATVATLILFGFAVRKYKMVWIVALVMLAIQGVLAYQRFYIDAPQSLPPRVVLLAVPSFALLLWAFLSDKGREIIKNIDLEVFTYLHTVRIAVELGLFFLCKAQLIPQSMTFEGRNFDILAGLTAPFVAFLFFSQKKMSKQNFLIWNIICLILVLQVVVTGILSVPSPFQQLEFEQPNIAVLRFPFVWLPSVIVPIVIFGHLAAIKKSLS